jgi:hypothetical protein
MVMQRWPAVPTEPKNTVGTARESSASGMTIAADEGSSVPSAACAGGSTSMRG